MPYIYTLLSPVFTLIFALTTFTFSFIVVGVGYISRDLQNKMLAVWSQISLWCAQAQVEMSGTENLPKQGAVYVFNHASFLDIFVVHGYMPGSFRFGAKMELFKIPFFGWAMRRVGNLEIPRQNLAQAIQVYERALKRMANGESFVLAPEGTRNKGEGVAPFKTGPFILAIKAQAPVVPIVITGVRHIYPPNRLFYNYFGSRKIYCDILPPIPSDGIALDERDSLKDRCRDVMVAQFEKRCRESGVS